MRKKVTLGQSVSTDLAELKATYKDICDCLRLRNIFSITNNLGAFERNLDRLEEIQTAISSQFSSLPTAEGLKKEHLLDYDLMRNLENAGFEDDVAELRQIAEQGKKNLLVKRLNKKDQADLFTI
ncbi:MAG: hypothetical protein CMP22_01385 [Rickettsiales bacterium]|nr:hypothetical protein [Rickettsiales bacterium]|tara:strand:+ start:212 stop:586 length:375 start_codon:yes stop_codon:yes gene_type:complete